MCCSGSVLFQAGLHEPFKGIVFAARGDAVSLLLASITLTARCGCGMAMSAHAVPFLYGRLPASFARQVDRGGRQMLKSTKIR